jgi:hypothetical protein
MNGLCFNRADLSQTLIDCDFEDDDFDLNVGDSNTKFDLTYKCKQDYRVTGHINLGSKNVVSEGGKDSVWEIQFYSSSQGKPDLDKYISWDDFLEQGLRPWLQKLP